MLLAEQTANVDSKQTLLHLVRSWTRLASELEPASALIEAINEMNLVEATEPGTDDGTASYGQANKRASTEVDALLEPIRKGAD
jgi:hypothetical protein